MPKEKVEFDSFTGQYTAKSIGYYNTREAAEAALKANRKDVVLSVAVCRGTKNMLERMASQKHITVSKLVREIIRKGVNDYGKGQ